MKHLIRLCFFLLVSHTSYGYVILLDDVHKEHLIRSNFVEIFKDASNMVTFDEIIRNPDRYDFYQGGEDEQFSYDINTNYWIRFKIQNKSALTNHWIVEILDSRFDEVVFYTPHEDSLQSYAESITGMKYDFSQREYKHKNFVFDIPLKGHIEESSYYYIKIHPGTIGSFLFKVRKSKVFISYGFNEYALLGMYYGIVLIMAFYNLFIYFTTREKVYIYYFLYAIGWGLDSSIHDGFGFQFLFSQNHWITEWGAYIFKVFLLISYLLYTNSFLDTRKTLPSWRKYSYVIGVILLLTSPFFIYIKHLFLYELLVFIYVLCMSIIVFNRGYKPARFLILGSLIILMGIFIKSINNAEWINFTLQSSTFGAITSVYARNISMVLDIVILSIALGDRIRFLKQVNEESQAEVIKQLNENKLLSDRANNELEKKVKERTRTIEEKNTLLKAQSEEINEINAILDRDNWRLRKNVIQEKEARISLKQISFSDFSLVYPNEESIDVFLEQVKWGNGYSCKKCNNNKYNKGATPLSRRCSNCRYDESITAFTVFHKCKFDLRKALYIAVMINRYGENIFIAEISRELEIRNATCWKFAQKLLETVNQKEYEKVKEEDKLNYLILNS